MTMITITDDCDKTVLFNINDYLYLNSLSYCKDKDDKNFVKEFILSAVSIINNNVNFMLYFNSKESRQKVWDRLCEITGARDIFEEKKVSAPPPPPPDGDEDGIQNKGF
jgi:hypothetical protein